MRRIRESWLLYHLDENLKELYQEETLKTLIESIDSFFLDLNDRDFTDELINFHHRIAIYTTYFLHKINFPTDNLTVGALYNISQLKNAPKNIKRTFIKQFLHANLELLSDISRLAKLEIIMPWRLDKRHNYKFVRDVFDKIQIRAIYNEEEIRLQSSISHEEQLENHRKCFLASTNSIEAILIKLVDRLAVLKCFHDEMYPLLKIDNYLKENIAHETLNIHAKLADYLGVGHIKWQLEDAAFRILHPAKYDEICRFIQHNRASRESYLEKVGKCIQERVKKLNIHAAVEGRAKHIYSVYKKMLQRKFNLNEMNDLLGIRIIIDGDSESENTKKCYHVLKNLHSLWKPIPGIYDDGKLFVDWIKNPKNNNYRSIHTTVVCEKNGIIDKELTLEVQIRTRRMHEDAMYGAASHWIYKEPNKSNAISIKKNKSFWSRMKRVFIENENGNQKAGIDSTLKNSCFVLTPEGEILELNMNATPLDFAIKLHTEFGEIVKAKKDNYIANVNGKQVPLDYHLQNTDIVEIKEWKTM